MKTHYIHPSIFSQGIGGSGWVFSFRRCLAFYPIPYNIYPYPSALLCVGGCSFGPGHAATPLLCAGCGDRAWSLRHSAAVLLEMIKIFKNSMLLVCFFCGSKTLLCCGDRVRWRRHSAAKSNVYCMLFSFGLLGASWGIRGCLSGALGNIMGMSVASLRLFLAPWGGPLTPWLALVSLDWFLAVFPACVVPEGFVAGQLLCAGCGLREQEIPNLNFWIAFPFNPLQRGCNSYYVS